MDRIPLIAGNWKMNKTLSEATELAVDLAEAIGETTDRDVMIAPPFIALASVREALEGSRIILGAQNMHSEDRGAFTGEVSPEMLLSVGCSHVILGHSERRHIFGETDDLIHKKVSLALVKDLTPVLCIGETLQERESGDAGNIVKSQLAGGLKNLTRTDVLRMIVAYEPVWAIGTGKTATPDQAQEMHGFIRRMVTDLYDNDVAVNVRILYGGSANSGNISQLMVEPDIDGALVGGASLKVDEFVKIVNFR